MHPNYLLPYEVQWSARKTECDELQPICLGEALKKASNSS